MPANRRLSRGLAIAVVLTVLGTGSATAQPSVPPGFDQRVLAAGIAQPTQMAWAPDGRMFVATKPGIIRVVSAAGQLLGTPLLDISSRVNAVQDRGLLGLAVDRDFATNGRLFYAYTYDLEPETPDSDRPTVARIESVVVSAANTASAPTVVLGHDVSGACPRAADDCIPSDGRSHGIGSIRVADDGTLFVGVGDSASYAQVDDLAFRAQEEGSLAGKLLHIDTQGRGLPGHPFCPAETDLTKACTKIYAKGFRNPFRFTLRDGVPMVGDVGWGDREELDRVLPGRNYGWPCWEGDRRTTGYQADVRCEALYAADTATAPVWTYPHANANAAIVAGPTLPPTSAYGPQFAGNLFVGDYATGLVQRLALAADGTCAATPCQVLPFATGWHGGTALEPSPQGNLAWALFGDGGPTGSITELVSTEGNRSPVAQVTATVLDGTDGRGYRLSASGSTDPDGDPLAAVWDLGDGTPPRSGMTVDHTYAAGVTRATATATVSDDRGGSATDTVTVTPGDLPPVPRIDEPADGDHYVIGEPVRLAGGATDAQDGPLTGVSLRWQIVLRHGTHVHPIGEVTGAEATFAPFDDHDADSGYEITLIATDSVGNRAASPTVEIVPETIPLTLRSVPEGARIGFGEGEDVAPTTRDAAVGYRTTLTAPARFTTGGKTYGFDSWSDGGAAQRAFVVPDSATTLTATYREDKAAGRPATASSSYSATYAPEKGVDGNAGTRWSSTFADGQWWRVDLGSPRAVDTIDVIWETARPRDWVVETSTDGALFTQAASASTTASGPQRVTFAPRTARYVRLRALTRATSWGVSFWEASVYGPEDPAGPTPPPPPPPQGDLARAGTASASTSYPGYPATFGNDGAATTRWSSAFTDGQWWQVDLGSTQEVGRVVITWETAYASRYDVQTSTDGVTYTTAATVDATEPGARTTTFTTRPARYVRVQGRTRATRWGISFYASEVYAR